MSCNSSQTSLQETILLTPRNTVRPATDAVGTTWTHTEPGTTNLSVHSQSPPFCAMPRPVSYFGSLHASPLWSTGGLFWTHGHLLWQQCPSLRGIVLLFIAVSAESIKACHPEDMKRQEGGKYSVTVSSFRSHGTAAPNGIMPFCNQVLFDSEQNFSKKECTL